MKRLLCAALSSLVLLAQSGQGVAASEVADAVMQGDAARLATLLKAHADVNAQQADGSTPLHWAAYHGDAATAAQLLAAGAHPNVTTDTGMAPLVLACRAGNADLVKELLDADANRNARMHSSTETRTVFRNQWLQEDETLPARRTVRRSSVDEAAVAARRRPGVA